MIHDGWGYEASCGEQYVVHGNLITLELLQEVFHEIDWSYICAESFDKKDFPVDGIQIE
jgi:hypothetical protein